MHKVNVLIMASMLALSTSTVLASERKSSKETNCEETGACINPVSVASSGEEVKSQIMRQRSLFDGLNLTVVQRQQMRDLIRQNYYDAMPKMYMENMEAMHQLVIADNFDEDKAHQQAEIIAKAQVERQVALAKVNHQFYSLLTPEQKIVFNRNHSERMEKMQQHLDQIRKYERPDPQ